MSELSNLVAEMEAFAKSTTAALPEDQDGKQDDKDIQAAAAAANADNADQEAGAGDDGKETEAGGDLPDDEDVDDGNDGKFGKSFEFELEDGQSVKAYDATPIIKSLQADMAGLRGEATGVMTHAFNLIKSQSAEIAGLKKQVGELAATGRGRKAIVTVTEKRSAADSLIKGTAGASPDEFFLKAESAQRAGHIDARDIALAEACINKGLPVPDRIASRVLGR